MGSEKLSDEDLAIWKRLCASYMDLPTTEYLFWEKDTNRVALIRHGLFVVDTLTVFYLAPAMKRSELMELFDAWVEWAAYGHRFLSVVQNIIKSLPRDWVLSNIETYAEPLLCDGTYEEYRRLLELYNQLDPALTRRLAQRAITNSDEDIREAGQDYLGTLIELEE